MRTTLTILVLVFGLTVGMAIFAGLQEVAYSNPATVWMAKELDVNLARAAGTLGFLAMAIAFVGGLVLGSLFTALVNPKGIEDAPAALAVPMGAAMVFGACRGLLVLLGPGAAWVGGLTVLAGVILVMYAARNW